jgi:hypothetical protein
MQPMTTQEYERREFARVAEAMQAPNAVFVFGSNLAGRHGAGAAKTARERYGAVQGRGEGLRGRSYGIPTKDRDLGPLAIEYIAYCVRRFLAIASAAQANSFVVTRIGCGLRGLPDSVVAPLFADAPSNCLLPIGWREMAKE